MRDKLYWIIYPPDYDQDHNANDIMFLPSQKASAIETLFALGKDTELWCEFNCEFKHVVTMRI